MTCYKITNNISCLKPFIKIRTNNGNYFYLSWNDYCGIVCICYNKYCNREIDKWGENKDIVDAVEWFINRDAKG